MSLVRPDLDASIAHGDPETARSMTSPAPGGSAGRIVSIASRLAGFRNISAIYVFLVIFGVFAVWIPETFLTSTTWRTLLNEQAITALAALGLIAPLAAGVFDLSIGSQVGLGAVLAGWLQVHHGLSPAEAVLLTVLVGAGVGLINGVLVAIVRLDSFIATLGVSSVLLAGVAWVSSGQQIVGLSRHFAKLASGQLFGLSYPVYYLLLATVALWYVLEFTPLGRRLYATGGNAEAAKLSGVRIASVVLGSFIACGVLAAFAGVLVSSQLGTADPTVGPSYLLPAFSAAFLGATQFRNGRFNVWGTVVAVYVLATGVKGLQLAGAPSWIPELFNGVALLVAVSLTRYGTGGRRGRGWHPRRRLGRRPRERGSAG